MNDFNELQNLWQEQKPTEIPNVKNILAKAKKVQNDLNKKIYIQVSILVAVVIFILLLVNVIPFKQLTTFVGIGLMAITILAFSGIRLYQVIQMKKIDLLQNPRHLLVDLEQYYEFQNKVNTKYTRLYFVLMNLAFELYFIEVLQPLSLMYKVISITIYLAWMLFALLYLGKKHAKKEQAKTQSIIDYVKLMQQNFEL